MGSYQIIRTEELVLYSSELFYSVCNFISLPKRLSLPKISLPKRRSKNLDRNESNECYQKVLKELQQLALIGMQKEQLIFDSELVNEQMKEPEYIKEFISSHVAHSKWHLVLQFLAGLLGREMKMSDRCRSCVLAFAEHLSCEIQDEDVGCVLFCRRRACSYDPACRDVSPSGTDITVRSYGVFHPACRDEILLLALAKHDISVTRHKYLTILAFFFIYLQQKALL